MKREEGRRNESVLYLGSLLYAALLYLAQNQDPDLETLAMTRADSHI